jgi:hypothetical protein
MFKLEDSDFKIDKEFRFSFERDVLNVDVSGDQSTFESLTEEEGQPFSWALYPPRFYIHDLPLPANTDINDFEYIITEDDIDEHEIDLYMMEYCTVYPCKVVGKNGLISISGMVHDIKKELIPLCIELVIT